MLFKRVFSFGDFDQLFEKKNNDNHVQSGNRQNMAYAALTECFGYFAFKLSSCADKYLFHKGRVPADKIFVYYGRNFFPYAVNYISGKSSVLSGNFQRFFAVSINRNSPGTVCDEFRAVFLSVGGKTYFAENFIIGFCGVFVPAGKFKRYFLRGAFYVDGICFYGKNRVAAGNRNFRNRSGYASACAVKGRGRVKFCDKFKSDYKKAQCHCQNNGGKIAQLFGINPKTKGSKNQYSKQNKAVQRI